MRKGGVIVVKQRSPKNRSHDRSDDDGDDDEVDNDNERRSYNRSPDSNDEHELVEAYRSNTHLSPQHSSSRGIDRGRDGDTVDAVNGRGYSNNNNSNNNINEVHGNADSFIGNALHHQQKQQQQQQPVNTMAAAIAAAAKKKADEEKRIADDKRRQLEFDNDDDNDDDNGSERSDRSSNDIWGREGKGKGKKDINRPDDNNQSAQKVFSLTSVGDSQESAQVDLFGKSPKSENSNSNSNSNSWAKEKKFNPFVSTENEEEDNFGGKSDQRKHLSSPGENSNAKLPQNRVSVSVKSPKNFGKLSPDKHASVDSSEGSDSESRSGVRSGVSPRVEGKKEDFTPANSNSDIGRRSSPSKSPKKSPKKSTGKHQQQQEKLPITNTTTAAVTDDDDNNNNNNVSVASPRNRSQREYSEQQNSYRENSGEAQSDISSIDQHDDDNMQQLHVKSRNQQQRRGPEEEDNRTGMMRNDTDNDTYNRYDNGAVRGDSASEGDSAMSQAKKKPTMWKMFKNVVGLKSKNKNKVRFISYYHYHYY